MRTLPRTEAQQHWQHYWDDMHQEWFKIEVLQDYAGEDDSPSLRAWLAGDRKTSFDLLKQTTHNGWLTMCQEKHSAGVLMRRIRIIEKPITPYTEWELEFYKHINIRGGEQVFLVDHEAVKGLDLPSGDLMMFDNKRVAVCAYDKTGRMVSETFYDEQDDISKFLRLKDKLLVIAPVAPASR